MQLPQVEKKALFLPFAFLCVCVCDLLSLLPISDVFMHVGGLAASEE